VTRKQGHAEGRYHSPAVWRSRNGWHSNHIRNGADEMEAALWHLGRASRNRKDKCKGNPKVVEDSSCPACSGRRKNCTSFVRGGGVGVAEGRLKGATLSSRSANDRVALTRKRISSNRSYWNRHKELWHSYRVGRQLIEFHQ
jgi:hypothetical protein